MKRIDVDALVNVNIDLLNKTNNYIEDITASISNNFNGVKIDSNKISNIIKVYYFDGITTALKKEIRKVNSSLEMPLQEFGTVSNNMEFDVVNFQKCASNLANVSDWLNKYNEQVIPELIKLIDKQYENTRYVYGPQYEEIMENIESDINKIISKFTNEYSDNMSAPVKSEINKLDINKNIDGNDITPFRELLDLSGYECHVIDNKVMLSDNTEVKIEDNALVSKDGNIEFRVGNKSSMYVNHEQNIKIIKNTDSIVYNKNGKFIELLEGFAGLELAIDGKIINDTKLQDELLYILRNNARGLYNLLKTDPNFSNRIKLIEEKEALLKNQVEIIKQKESFYSENENIAFKPFG